MDIENIQSIDDAVQIFKELMKNLELQFLNPPQNLKYIVVTSFKHLCHRSLERCIVIPKKVSFEKSKLSTKGLFIWRFIEEKKLHILYIVLNNDLFEDINNNEKRIIQKAIFMHEFTHCIAHILTVLRLDDVKLTKREEERLRKKIHLIAEDDTQKILWDITANHPQGEYSLHFPDEHFRTGDEDFKFSYSDLYINLLLNYELLSRFFTDQRKEQLFRALKESDDSNSARAVIDEIEKEICQKENLSIDFVKKRVSDFQNNIVHSLNEYYRHHHQ